MGTIALKSKKILVVGGNGYLGSFLVEALKEKEADVYILSHNCEESANQFKVDITNFDAVQKVVQHIKPDVIYHLAASISRNRDFAIYEAMAAVNVQGLFNVLNSLQDLDTHFIFTSSSEIYGNNESPFHENQVPKPVSPYSLTKTQGEYLMKYSVKTMLKIIQILEFLTFLEKECQRIFSFLK